MNNHVKFFEVRDRMTRIPVMVTRLLGDGFGTSFGSNAVTVAMSAGFSPDCPPFFFVNLNNGKCQHDPFEWNDRTFHVSHSYVVDNWDTLKDGDVVDVEFILGETKERKSPEICWRMTVG